MIVINGLLLGNNLNDVNDRKEWFIRFAKEKGFDPLMIKNWDKISISQIHTVKV